MDGYNLLATAWVWCLEECWNGEINQHGELVSMEQMCIIITSCFQCSVWMWDELDKAVHVQRFVYCILFSSKNHVIALHPHTVLVLFSRKVLLVCIQAVLKLFILYKKLRSVFDKVPLLKRHIEHSCDQIWKLLETQDFPSFCLHLTITHSWESLQLLM